MASDFDLDICRLCFASQKTSEDNELFSIRTHETLLNELAGFQMPTKEFVSNKVCSNCEYHIESTLLLQKRVKFAQHIWMQFQDQIQDSQQLEQTPIACDKDLLLNCHQCGSNFDHIGLKAHINEIHGQDHAEDCVFCLILLNSCSFKLEEPEPEDTVPTTIFLMENPLDPKKEESAVVVSQKTLASKKAPKSGTAKKAASPYECPFCPYISTRSNNFKRHVRDRHTSKGETMVTRNNDNLSSDLMSVQETYPIEGTPETLPLPNDHENITGQKYEPTEVVKEDAPPVDIDTVIEEAIEDEGDEDYVYEGAQTEDSVIQEPSTVKAVAPKNPLECPFCGIVSTRMPNLRRHMMMHTGYNCTKCPAKFPTYHTLRDHVRAMNHQKDPTFIPLKSLECPICGAVSSRTNNLRRHMHTLHGVVPGTDWAKAGLVPEETGEEEAIKEQTMVEEDTSKLTEEHSSFDDTIIIEEPITLTPTINLNNNLRCTVCGITSSRSNNLRRHMKLVHGIDDTIIIEEPITLTPTINLDNNLRCTVCGITSSRSNNLRRHMKLVHGIDALTKRTEGKVKESNDASQDFGDLTHAPSLAPSKPIIVRMKLQCHVCKVVFKSEDNFKLHMKRHDNLPAPTATEEEDHSEASQDFSSFEESNDILEATSSAPQKPFECTICGTMFHNQESYEAHEASHANEKIPDNFYMEVVDTIPVQQHHRLSNDIEETIIIEEDETAVPLTADPNNTLQCKICLIVPTRIASLRRHMRMVHGVDLESNQPVEKFAMKRSNPFNEDFSKYEKRARLSAAGIRYDQAELPGPQYITDFVCHFCNLPMPNLYTLLEHVRSKHNSNHPRAHPCKYCSEVFDEAETYHIHLTAHAEYVPEDSAFACSCCDNVYDNVESLTEHILWHDQSVYGCNQCEAVFATSKQFFGHMARKHSLNNIKCSHCDFKSLRIFNLRRHMVRVHGDRPEDFDEDYWKRRIVENTEEGNEEIEEFIAPYPLHHPLQCKVCGHYSSRTQNLYRHMRTHVGSSRCKHCLRIFPDEQSLWDHVRDNHKDSDTMVVNPDNDDDLVSETSGTIPASSVHAGMQCQVCSKAFTSVPELKRHMQLHTGFCCKNCTDVFEEDSQLAEHVRLKHNNDQLRCRQCDIRFESVAEQKAHTSTHPERKQLCNLCGKITSSMKQHMLRHQGIRSWVCPLEGCRKGFFDKKQLDIHMTVHSDERRFPCTICEKRFKTNRNLQVHLRMHAGDKRHVCTFENCTQRFVQSFDLVLHMRRHRGEKPFGCERCKECFISKSILRKHWKHCLG